MARKKYSPEETLRALYNLQYIDSRIDRMREVRGELPMEVKDLEDEMEGLNKRVEKIEEEMAEVNHLILEKKNIIEESKSTIKKYEELTFWISGYNRLARDYVGFGIYLFKNSSRKISS